MSTKTGNIRDLGGIETADGRRVRAGTLFRSEALTTLDTGSRRWLAGVPVKLVFDLRSVQEGDPTEGLWERAAAPDVVHIPLFPLARVRSPDLVAGLLADETGGYARGYMQALYREMVDLFPTRALPEFARLVGAEQRVPVLVHCTAGQDRTGFLTALALLALGVGREKVIADYVRSADHFGLDRMLEWTLGLMGPDPAEIPSQSALAPLGAHAAYLEMALDLIDERHGSAERYWSEAAGIGPAGLAQLRATLLSPPG